MWQSSLRRVELLDVRVEVGQRWIDVTSVGLRPAMETVELDRPRRWTERGQWRAIQAELTLTLSERPDGGCRVDAQARVARGAVPTFGAITAAARLVVPRDLKRAARVLSERASGK